jgi:hypothetical protein
LPDRLIQPRGSDGQGPLLLRIAEQHAVAPNMAVALEIVKRPPLTANPNMTNRRAGPRNDRDRRPHNTRVHIAPTAAVGTQGLVRISHLRATFSVVYQSARDQNIISSPHENLLTTGKLVVKAASSTCFNLEFIFHVIHPGFGSESTGRTVGMRTKFERY